MNETQYVQKDSQVKMSKLSKVLWVIAAVAIVTVVALYFYGKSVYNALPASV